MVSSFTVIALSLVAIVASLPLRINDDVIYAKELAGPASEFPLYQFPTPDSAPVIQSSSFNALWLTSESLASFSTLPPMVLMTSEIIVDSTTSFQFSFLSPQASQVTLSLVDPNGHSLDLSGGVDGVFAIGGTNVPETSWNFLLPVVGTYILSISSSTLSRSDAVNNDLPFGYVIVHNDSPLTLISYLSSFDMQQGQNVGLIAFVVDNLNATRDLRALPASELRTRALREVVTQAIMEIQMPDGTEASVKMHDDGLHGDFEANDGVYGGQIVAQEVGTYQAQAILTGTVGSTTFQRTAQQLIASVPDEVTLTGTATGAMTDAEHLTISLAVTIDSTMHDVDETFRAYAEVWGQDSTGNQVAVCWIGGITQLSAGNMLDVVLDIKWMSLAGVTGPLTLENVIIQETQAFVPLSTYPSISVQMSAVDTAVMTSSLAQLDVMEITKEMKQGVLADYWQQKKNDNAAVNGAVILLHGYCSGTNPFATYPADWTNAFYYLDASASNTHDAFALKVINYAKANNINSYSLVGHSQGGLVAAHILNYYQSGMDLLVNGRLIQSIGSPYEGCTAAGSAANLGKSFGVGCGTNYDLSRAGAKVWEPTLTTDTRSEINYFTTTYELGTWFGDSCSAPMNMILEWPNDGTAELEFTDLRGANNLGNTQKQCHTTGMNYSPQYYDNARNKKMNAAAART